MEPLRIFIGVDENEVVAFHACVNSLIRHSSKPLSIVPLFLDNMRDIYSESHTGELVEEGYEPSNAFIFSRFLVPYLSGYEGTSLFIDGDMIIRDDVSQLFEAPIRDPLAAVQVVKHPDYETKAPIKYATASQPYGSVNRSYKRKNWSSVMLWNNQYCKTLTPEYVMNATGAELHQFKWLDDNRIGSLPPEWNFLVGEYDKYDDGILPSLMHYTLGTPCWLEHCQDDYANEWHKELLLALGAYRETPVEMVLRSNQLLVDEKSAEKSAA